MKRSNNKNKSTAAVYARLSRDDELNGESNSITNQKKMCCEKAKALGFTDIKYYVDDGISGMDKYRPQFQKMITDIKGGKIGAVISKDQSRLSRDIVVIHEFVGLCVDEDKARLVLITESFDSSDHFERTFFGFRAVLNEAYAEDISKKCRMAIQSKGGSGVPLGRPPYGYMADPINTGFWIVDDTAAVIVRRIFNSFLSGRGVAQIAAELETEGVLTPMNYAISKGFRKGGKNSDKPSKWGNSTVIKILKQQAYCGDIINFKTCKKSYRNKKQVKNDNPLVFHDKHEPIIDRDKWEQVQEIREKIKKRTTNEGERNMFSGLLKCADCGKSLGYHFNQKNPDLKYFNCTGYNKCIRECPTPHHLRADFLEEIVLEEVKRLTSFVRRYADVFERAVRAYATDNTELERKRMEKEMKAAQSRKNNIDVFIQRLYEDNIIGKVSDERFTIMTAQYEREQADIVAKIGGLQEEMQREAERAQKIDVFVAAVKKYTRIRKVTQEMLYDLVDRIEVHETQKIDGKNVQNIDIYYKCVGKIEIPDILPIPQADVQINTRKGVNLKYEAKRKAASA